MKLVSKIISFHMKHNSEHEAVDLSLEVERLDVLKEHVEEENCTRTCEYLTEVAKLLSAPDDINARSIVYELYLKFNDYPSALLTALRLKNWELIEEVMELCIDPVLKRQLCLILAPHGRRILIDETICPDEEERCLLEEIMRCDNLSEAYCRLAGDVEVVDPKSPDDIYKQNMPFDPMQESEPRQFSLADIFVNAFLNAGFREDTRFIKQPEASDENPLIWSFLIEDRNKHMATALASQGMILLWDFNSGHRFESHRYSKSSDVIAGETLGLGLLHCGITPGDEVMGNLCAYTDYMHDAPIRIAATMALGLAIADSQFKHKLVIETFRSHLGNMDLALDEVAFTAISLGLILVGSCDKVIANMIMSVMKARCGGEFTEPICRFLPVGLALLYLGGEEKVYDMINLCGTLDDEIRSPCIQTLLSCAYAGTGNVLKIQEFLNNCHEGAAVLAIALVAMAEEVGLEMATRHLEHILKYGEQRKAVPLALGVLYISNPKKTITKTLCKLSCDADTEVAMAAIVSLGLVGSGTSNASLADMLCKLASRYQENSNLLFCVRIAQGLVHLGKGLLTLSPYYFERSFLSLSSLAGLVILLHALLDMNNTILGKYHDLLFYLTLAIKPRMLMTLNEELDPLSVPVRVGQAVDVAARAGRPNTITGFQTQSTPVILSAGD